MTTVLETAPAGAATTPDNARTAARSPTVPETVNVQPAHHRERATRSGYRSMD